MSQGAYTRARVRTCGLPTRDHHGTQWRAYRSLPPGPPLTVEQPGKAMRCLIWLAAMMTGSR